MSQPSPDQMLWMYRQMQRIRQFEEKVYYLFLQGDMPGTLHLYMGEEACAVGVCSALNQDDYITSTHRPHGHAIAKGATLNSMMAELYAKTTGCAGGYGGSMHTGDMAVGSLPAIAIVGGGVPIATGIGLACKMQKRGSVVACFMGDGATNEGAFHEGVNMAAIWSLPVIFVVENNRYGASTPVGQVTKLSHLAERAAGYGIPGVTVDGMDSLAVRAEVEKAVTRARADEGPTLVECETYRFCGHSRSDTCGYRPAGEQEEWKKRDPLLNMEKALKATGQVSEEQIATVAAEVTQEIEESIAFAKASPSPTPEDCLKHVFVD